MDKVGRNDPCPCGSGKKYKKCCELKNEKKGLNARTVTVHTAASKVSSLFFKNAEPGSPLPHESPHPDL